MYLKVSSVQFSSVAQSCLTLCDPMNRRTPGLPVHHQLPDFIQTHVHRVTHPGCVLLWLRYKIFSLWFPYSKAQSGCLLLILSKPDLRAEALHLARIPAGSLPPTPPPDAQLCSQRFTLHCFCFTVVGTIYFLMIVLKPFLPNQSEKTLSTWTVFVFFPLETPCT